MLFYQLIWDHEEDKDGNVQHIAEHGITVEEVEEVLQDRYSDTTESLSSGEKLTFGYTVAGRYLGVVWEKIEDGVGKPITAFDAPEPGT